MCYEECSFLTSGECIDEALTNRPLQNKGKCKNVIFKDDFQTEDWLFASH